MSEDITLSREQFWKWRNFVLDMQLAEQRNKNAEQQYALICKDIEISRIKSELFKVSALTSSKERLALAKKEYDEVRAELEKELGISLTDCVIDEVTLKVVKLDSTTPER